MGEKIIILDVIVMGTLYLYGFATAVKYAAEIGETWTALNLPTLGIMAVDGGIWFFIRKRIKWL